MGGGTSLKHWFTSSVKKRCAKGFKLGTGPHKCAQWRRIGFYGSCLRVWQSDSELAWHVPQALMATMKLQVMKVPVASRVAGPEWPPCYVFKFTALRPVNWPAAACKCFSTWLQSVASKLPGFQCHSASHWHAAARTRTSKWRPGPAMSWPARAAPRVPRPTSDTSRQVTGKRRADNLMSIGPVKGNSNTDVLTLTVQWYCQQKVCTRLRVRILQLCILFQIVWNFVYTRIFPYIRVYIRIR